AEAERAANSIGARAFTVGRDIYLSRQAPPVDSPAARPLIAHELTHVVRHAVRSGEPRLYRDSLATFRAALEATSPNHGAVIGELFRHPDFIPLVRFLDNCPPNTVEFF